jgi:hemoglobin/transferrin/lactoferrin receptor protein
LTSLLDNVGIFYGPASTLFGSDALGGAVSMTTKKAKF